MSRRTDNPTPAPRRLPRHAQWIAAALIGWSWATLGADFDCVILPRQILEIRSPSEGLIERVMVDRGDRVSAGQEIAFIDPSVELQLAESALYRSRTSGAIRAGESRVQLGVRKLKRAEDLLRKNFVAAQLRDEAVNEKQVADAELLEARENRRLAEIEYRRQLAIIRLKTIRSPIDGVVTERILNPGEMAEVSVGRKPIVKLAETGVLYVEALLPADAYRQLKPGMSAEVVPQLQGANSYRATVAVVDSVLDPASGTFGVRLELPNPNGELPAGVRCKVDFASVTAPASTLRGGTPDRATREVEASRSQ